MIRDRLYDELARRKSQDAPSADVLAAIGEHEVDGRPLDEPNRALLRGTRIGRKLIADTWVHRIAPARRDAKRCIVYLHGGGYTGGPSWLTWLAAGRLARELDAEVWLPCYRLAPRQTAELTVPKSTACLLAARRAWPDGPLVVAGDSAGGGLALAVTQLAIARGAAAPDALALLSPWSDLTCPDADTDGVDLRDPFLATASGLDTARLYAGSLPLDDPRVSPINGSMAGLPATWLFGGDRDVLIYQIRRLATRLRQAGVPVEFVQRPDGVHVEPLFPTPPGRRLFAEMKQFIARTTPTATGRTSSLSSSTPAR